MRVTQNTNFEAVRDSIRRSKERLENLQIQTSSLKKLNAPSDNPVGASKLLEIRTDKFNNDQYQTNAKLAEAFLNNSDHAIADLVDVIDRAKEVALSQSSGASSNEDTRLGVAEEVSQLYQHAVATANRRIGDRYLFGGYRTDRPPVDPDGRYHGDSGQMMVEVAKDVFVAMNVDGLEAFNSNPKTSADQRTMSRSPAQEHDPELDELSGPPNMNLFDELQNLRIGLLTGDTDQIRNTLERFDAMHSKMISVRAKIGSRIQGLQSTTAALERHNLTNAQLSSALEDADMAQVVSEMAKEETVLRGALQSSQKLMQQTLMDFLK